MDVGRGGTVGGSVFWIFFFFGVWGGGGVGGKSCTSLMVAALLLHGHRMSSRPRTPPPAPPPSRACAVRARGKARRRLAQARNPTGPLNGRAGKGLIRDLATLSLESTGPPPEGPGLRTRAHARGLGRAEPARGRREWAGPGRGLGAEERMHERRSRAPAPPAVPASRSDSRAPARARRRRRRGTGDAGARRSRACACAWAVPPSGARRAGAAAAGLARESRTGVPGTLPSALAGDSEMRARGRWVLAGIAAAFCLWASYKGSVSVCRRDGKVVSFHLDCKGRSQSQRGKGSHTHTHPKAQEPVRDAPTLPHPPGNSQGNVSGLEAE